MKIHLAIDGTEHSFAAEQFIWDLPLPEGSEVIALGVVSQRHTLSRYLLMAALDKTQTILQDSGAEVRTGLLHGNPAEALTYFADKQKADLMVVRVKGLRATLGILLGGVAQQLVEYARWPVLVVGASYEKLKRLLLVVDNSTHSQYAVESLIRFPFQNGKELFVMHFLPPMPEPDETVYIGRYPHHYIEFLPVSSCQTEVAIARQAEFEGQVSKLSLPKSSRPYMHPVLRLPVF